MKSTNISIQPILIACLSFFGFSCQQKQARSFACAGFQDTILHKFVYKTTDVSPKPIGGNEAVSNVINKYFKYPEGDYQGKVLVAFVIETNGKIDGKRIIYDPSGNDRLFSKQLLTILDKVKWQPGLCNGEKVPCLYIFPMNVDLVE